MSATPPYAIPNDAKVYVAGHRGLVGGAITRALEARGLPVLGRASSQLDLRDRGAVEAFFDAERPTHVVLAAAKVGGILANSTYPADFLSDHRRWSWPSSPAPARPWTRPR
jgi:GDP-L-fucose synthase